MRNLTYANENDITFTFEQVLEFFDSLVTRPGSFVKMIYSPNNRMILITKHGRSYLFKEVE